MRVCAMKSLVVFENVVGLEPKKFMGDNFSKVTNILKVAQYNVACCYSQINEVGSTFDRWILPVPE